MTPRSPPQGGRPRTASRFTANAMDKWSSNEENSVPVQVLVATSFDNRHPPEDAVNKKEGSFWITTGMYPQEIVIGFQEEQRIAEIKTISMNVKSLSIERVIPKKTANTGPVEWKRIATFDFPKTLDEFQVEIHKLNNVSSKYIKIVIHSGYDLFSALYSVQVCNVDGVWLNQ